MGRAGQAGAAMLKRLDTKRPKSVTEELLDLRSMQDFYVLGIVCTKLGLCELALAGVELLTQPDEGRLFALGREDAEHMTVQDVATEIAQVRRNNPEEFDLRVEASLGPHGLERIKRQVMETPDQALDKETALDMLGLFVTKHSREDSVVYCN